jgi:hypothetical protein
MRKYLQTRLDVWRKLRERNRKCALTGGMEEREFQEFVERTADYNEDLIAHPEKIKKTPEVNLVSRVIACGTGVATE